MKKNKVIKLIGILASWAVVIAYILIGTIANIWHPTWILFLLIPTIEELYFCIKNKDFNRFPIVFIVVGVYLALGLTLGIWHPMWVILLLIPLYYTTVNILTGKDNDKDENNDDEDEDEDKTNEE